MNERRQPYCVHHALATARDSHSGSVLSDCTAEMLNMAWCPTNFILTCCAFCDVQCRRLCQPQNPLLSRPQVGSNRDLLWIGLGWMSEGSPIVFIMRLPPLGTAILVHC